jgi:hypothetical protein
MSDDKKQELIVINQQDLSHINSIALNFFKDYNPDSIKNRYGVGKDTDSLRTLAYLEGVLGHLRSRGLISFDIVFDKRK